MAFRIDLHTHSYGSPDGRMRAADYKKMLLSGKLDYIAITDHDTVEAAVAIKERLGDLGERIIVGQEITTANGEIIGLFLKHLVEPGQSIRKTTEAIHEQGGLVYVPHPFETVRKGVSLEALDSVSKQVDIVEVWNGRAVFQNKSHLARRWAKKHHVVGACSSDAHGKRGWGRTYTLVNRRPKPHNLVDLLSSARLKRKNVHIGIVYPKLNRVYKKIRGSGSLPA